MIEALMMGGGAQGPRGAWQYIAGAAQTMTAKDFERPFPSGVQTGDLVIAVLSVTNDAGSTSATDVPMISAGWQKWGFGASDKPVHCVCAARYHGGLEAPKWQAAGVRLVDMWVGVFRATGWTTVRLESQRAPAIWVALETPFPNTLVLNIGVTPGQTADWYGWMDGATGVRRYIRPNGPSTVVYATNIPAPTSLTNIKADAVGDERNLILTAF